MHGSTGHVWPGYSGLRPSTAQAQTVFRGETLRGLLLNAYAFGTRTTR